MRERGRGGTEGEGRLLMNWKTAEVICVTDSFLLSCLPPLTVRLTDKEITTTSLLFIKMVSLCC